MLEAVRLPLLSANFLHTTVWNNQIVKECEECRDMVFNALAYHADASSSLHQRNARIRQPPRQFYAFSRDADTHYERYKVKIVETNKKIINLSDSIRRKSVGKWVWRPKLHIKRGKDHYFGSTREQIVVQYSRKLYINVQIFRFALTNVGPLLYVIGGDEMGKV